MSSIMLGMLAETFIHPGGGRDEGVIDLPVAREAATDYPFIAGSSLKGALRDAARQKWPDGKTQSGADQAKIDLSSTVIQMFGQQDNAGELLVSDARLLLLPVRSLNGAYKWVTCPLILERLARDWGRVNPSKTHSTDDLKKIFEVDENKFFGQGEINKSLYLEERSFQRQDSIPDSWTEIVKDLICHTSVQARIDDQLVVIHNNAFAWFARYGLAVQARNALKENKTSDNLWYEETLPPDTLMYASLMTRNKDQATISNVNKLFEHPYLQVGGNETVGQGWFAIKISSAQNPINESQKEVEL